MRKNTGQIPVRFGPHFSVGLIAKIPDCLVKYRTSGNLMYLQTPFHRFVNAVLWMIANIPVLCLCVTTMVAFSLRKYTVGVKLLQVI